MQFMYLLILTLLISTAHAFEGVVVYSQTDYMNGKKVPTITQKISAYYKDNLLVRLHTEYDKTKFSQESNDIFISHVNGKVSHINKTANSYSESTIDKKIPIDHETIKLGKGDTIEKQETTIYTFADKATAKKIEIHYSNVLKVTPTPYLIKNLASMAWGIHPITGAVAMKFDMTLDNDLRRVIQVTSVVSRPLKPVDFIAPISGLDKI